MLITIAAVGRLRAGAERDLAARYFDRAKKLSGSLGLDINLREIADGRESRPKDRRASEAASIEKAIAPAARLWLLDETGATPSSTDFSDRLARLRDAGNGDLAIVIGGAEGLDDDLKARADALIAFGPMTWPHQLVRVMLLEQLYRAMTLIAGHPYHRG